MTESTVNPGTAVKEPEPDYKNIIDSLPFTCVHARLFFDENGQIEDYVAMSGNKFSDDFHRDLGMGYGSLLVRQFMPITGKKILEELNNIRNRGFASGHFLYDCTETGETFQIMASFDGDGWVNLINFPMTEVSRDREKTVRDLKEEQEAHKREEARQQALKEEYEMMWEEQTAVFNHLARNFKNVYLLDMEHATVKVLKYEDTYEDAQLPKAGIIYKTFPYAEPLHRWILSAVHPDDREMLSRALDIDHLREVFRTQNEYTGTYRVVEGDRILNFQYSLSRMSKPTFVIAGFQNIDSIIAEHLEREKKEREKEIAYQKQLMAAKKAADEANAAKTEFLLRMSHDIRTPLNGIVGMLDIADRYPDDIERQSECRGKIKEASKILLELVNEVLDMSKLESGEIVLEQVPFDLLDIARDVFLGVSEMAQERGVEIVNEGIDREIHRRVIGSPTHCKRLMMNIVSNAVKYNKENGKVYMTCREISCDGKTAMIEFTCRDTGIGMSPEFMQHLFEPFVQEHPTARSRYGGSGLGMAIAKSIADKMGGSISAESEVGVGSTFTVRLPLEIDMSEGAVTAQEAADEQLSIRGMKIILAEDNDLNMEIAHFVLNEDGADVTCVFNGQEAVDAFAASEPGSIDAILMDVMMPVMNGYDATRAIRKLERPDAGDVPIIAMTANAFAEDRIKSRRAGMNEHISKPLDTKQVIRTVAELVKAYRRQ